MELDAWVYATVLVAGEGSGAAAQFTAQSVANTAWTFATVPTTDS